MSNVASLELCKELYSLSGWETPYFFTEDILGKDRDYQHIRYDLGYLLRKLPTKERTHESGYKTFSPFRLKRINKNHWEAGYPKLWCQSDTPEDAACKLAIELFRQGILTKGTK